MPRPANSQSPFLPPAGEGGIRRSPARRMTEEGESHRQQTVKSLLFPLLRSFLHCGPAAFSLSCRPLGGTLPRWGRERMRASWMTAMSGEFAAFPCRARRPRRAGQQHQRQGPHPRNSQLLIVGNVVLDVPQQHRGYVATSGEFATFHCRGRRPRRPRSSTAFLANDRRIRSRLIVGKGLALSAQQHPRDGKPGRMRCTPADSPKVGGDRGILCRKGQAPSLHDVDVLYREFDIFYRIVL